MSVTSRMRKLKILEFVISTIVAFFRTVCYDVMPKSSSLKMWYDGHCEGMTGRLGFCFCMLALSAELLRLMEEYDVDPLLGIFASARVNEIDLNVADVPRWVSFLFGDSIEYNLMEFENPGRSSITHPALSVRYRDQCPYDRICVAFFSDGVRLILAFW